MTNVQRTVSPVDGSVYVERQLATAAEIDVILGRASEAQRRWRNTPIAERVSKISFFVDRVLGRRETLCHELTMQMGRPVAQAPGELAGFEERARTMLALAPEVLADIALPDKEGFTRYIGREPLGVVLVLSPWNYPWMTAVNAVVPALAAGNAVVLKHSDQTPLVSERYEEAGREAGLPQGLLAHVHASHEQIAGAIDDARVAHVCFTGSVEGGRAVHRAAAERFITVGLELGGKDPAYVRPDADIEGAAAGIVDGGMFNAGQSCCGLERVYVHEDVYDRFVDALVAEAEKLVLGDPREETTTLGPIVRERNALAIQAQVEAAVKAGAKPLLDARKLGDHELPYLAPQLLVDVTHEMDVMREETFGPVLGIMKVRDDEEAVELMNDSRYGLTAALWTEDLGRAAQLADRIETGTVFTNRSDYLDPELAWVGVKDSGRGVTLSRIGYEHLTRPKSFHFKHRP